MRTEHTRSAVRQEPADIAGKPVIVAGAIVVVVSAVSVAIMAFMLHARIGRVERSPTAEPTIASATPLPIERSVIREAAVGQRLQENARRQLDEWGWVDKGKVARIPISAATRALVREVQQGKLDWPDQEAKPNAGSGEVAP